jgi:small subunit ribosomal protein S27e
VACTYKLNRLYGEPDSYFMYVKCGGCGHVTVCFSHSATTISCTKCHNVILRPGKRKAVLAGESKFKKITGKDLADSLIKH